MGIRDISTGEIEYKNTENILDNLPKFYDVTDETVKQLMQAIGNEIARFSGDFTFDFYNQKMISKAVGSSLDKIALPLKIGRIRWSSNEESDEHFNERLMAFTDRGGKIYTIEHYNEVMTKILTAAAISGDEIPEIIITPFTELALKYDTKDIIYLGNNAGKPAAAPGNDGDYIIITDHGTYPNCIFLSDGSAWSYDSTPVVNDNVLNSDDSKYYRFNGSSWVERQAIWMGVDTVLGVVVDVVVDEDTYKYAVTQQLQDYIYSLFTRLIPACYNFHISFYAYYDSTAFVHHVSTVSNPDDYPKEYFNRTPKELVEDVFPASFPHPAHWVWTEWSGYLTPPP